MRTALFLSFLFVLGASAQEMTAEHVRSLFTPLDPEIDQNASDYYLGYRGNDVDTTWGKYFNDTPVPLQKHLVDGLKNSPVPKSQGVSFKNAGAALNQPGYLPLENGFTYLPDGTLELAIRTDVADDFTGEQYDFWFSWHVNETSKYKLWYPAAHQYAAVNNDQVNYDPSKPYRERYWNVTSLVDEYIGPMAMKLSITFFDPSLQGFTASNPSTGVETLVVGWVNPLTYTIQNATKTAETTGFTPLSAALIHQVRKKPYSSGKEIRSRFYFGSLLVAGIGLLEGSDNFARYLSEHCNSEMSHLSTFLPRLFEEFKDDIPT